MKRKALLLYLLGHIRKYVNKHSKLPDAVLLSKRAAKRYDLTDSMSLNRIEVKIQEGDGPTTCGPFKGRTVKKRET